MTASVYMKVNTVSAWRHSLFRVKIEKLQCMKLTITAPERLKN